MHNYELDLGAANALCLKLGYILMQNSQSNEFYMEVEMLCASLKMVYGCSVERRIHSFRDIGCTELLPLLVQVLTIADIQAGSSQAILQALHVVRVFSKLDIAKSYLVNCPNLWTALVQIIWSLESNEGNNWIVLEKDAESVQLEILGVVKDLCFRTSDRDKQVVYNAKGLTPTLLHFGRKETARRLREYVAAIWWNLAMSSNVGHEMAKNDEVLQSLQNLMLPNETVKTRRNAVSSIGNLATVPINHEALLSHQDGALVECLVAAAKNEDDTDSRRRAMRTLRCLCSGKAAHTLRIRSDFCEFLSSAAQNDVDRDTRIQALECIAYIAADGEAMAKIGDGIKTALIGTIENSNESKLTVAACKTLSVCLSEADPTARAFSTAFYAKLATAATESLDGESHQNVANVLSLVAVTDGFAEKVPPSSFLNLLAVLLSPVGPDFEASRGVAWAAIKALADVDSNKRPLAEDEGLLTALVNFVMATGQADKKDEAKSLILKLIPEL